MVHHMEIVMILGFDDCRALAEEWEGFIRLEVEGEEGMGSGLELKWL